VQTATVEVAAGVGLEDAGDGPPDASVVLLRHGSGPSWRQFTPQLEEPSDRWRVIASRYVFGR
jgi:hypothetical protein